MTPTTTSDPAAPDAGTREMPWTPAPWRFGERNPYPDEPLEISILATNPRTGGDYCVAVAIPCGMGERTRDVTPHITEANARLIAAAPDLFSALQTSTQALHATLAILSRPSLQPFLKEIDQIARARAYTDFTAARQALARATAPTPSDAGRDHGERA